MSVLVVGISHRSAPVPLLERLALDDDGAAKVLADVAATEHVREAAVVSTCNRVEIYVDVERFHGSVEDVSARLTAQGGVDRDDVVPHLYVHYDDAAVAHLFAVAAGLDSMVVGESQVLSQVRAALLRGQDAGTVGPALNALFQQALRVGKRGHAETGIDRTGPSLVGFALDQVEQRHGSLASKRALVVGAGAMAGLVASTLRRREIGSLVVVNRTPERAERLAQAWDGRAAAWDDLTAELAGADLLVSCTGSTAPVVRREQVESARQGRTDDLIVIDLALPHDVEQDVVTLQGVHLLGLADLAAATADSERAADVAQVKAIVADEVRAFLAARSAARVTPAVVALRSMATEVVDAELERLRARLPGLDERARAELEQTVRRVADKLLHQPTVRIKELVDHPGGVSYAAALADLFALDPASVEAVTRPEVSGGGSD